jgi:hypothetical protein
MIASAGLLTEANESSLMMTAVPVLAERLEGTGHLRHRVRGFFSNHTFGCDFGDRFRCRDYGGSNWSFTHLRRFSYQHFSDAGLNGSSSLGRACITQNLDTGFNQDAAGLAIPFAREQPGTSYRPTTSILTTRTAVQLVA